jgi:predicted dehydrogenase
MNTTSTESSSLTRRALLTAATAASYSRVLGANDRIQVGLIGCGNLGMRHLRLYLKPILDDGTARLAGISDIYKMAKERARQQGQLENKDVYHDYRDLLARKDIDAIYVVTPEHWHFRMAMDALHAGKDVYLEKPMTYTVEQAKELAAEVNKTGRVLQVGAQWCSDPRYHAAREIIEKGWIGNVLWAQSTYSMNSVYGVWQYDVEKEATPENIDWQAFLGSAPKRPFSGERFFRWRKYWDYSNGVVADFFYHRLAPLMLTLGGRFPILVSGHGGIYSFKDRETPDTFSLTAEYDNFSVQITSSAACNGINRDHAPAIFGHEATITFFEEKGSDGYITVVPDSQFRKKFQEATGKPELRIATNPSQPNDIRINHARNFFACMKSRQKPILHADLAYQTMTAIKLSADSYRQRRMFAWDPKTQTIAREAPPRPGWEGTGENYKEPV